MLVSKKHGESPGFVELHELQNGSSLWHSKAAKQAKLETSTLAASCLLELAGVCAPREQHTFARQSFLLRWMTLSPSKHNAPSSWSPMWTQVLLSRSTALLTWSPHADTSRAHVNELTTIACVRDIRKARDRMRSLMGAHLTAKCCDVHPQIFISFTSRDSKSATSASSLQSTTS
eukprot:TRINITY_DN9195_c0_g1_i1.p2 TRINITY_DN9195_c0_g1~~TRINITY_DN9195_c0_g1_i1.p2  ORF type:complete len:175 (-),score=16.98 TRINITY_DN9195_c0_g1_i1:690-1214(-)